MNEQEGCPMTKDHPRRSVPPIVPRLLWEMLWATMWFWAIVGLFCLFVGGRLSVCRSA
jgi:hypothetical protein